MLAFDHLNSISLPAIFDELFKPFKEQHSHNTREARRYVLNIPKMKTSFYGSRSVQVKSIKDWNNIIAKIHFTTEDFMKCSEVLSSGATLNSGSTLNSLFHGNLLISVYNSHVASCLCFKLVTEGFFSSRNFLNVPMALDLLFLPKQQFLN